MSDRARRKELRKAGVAAARDARAVLAEAIALLDAEVASTELGRAIAQRVTVAVAALYRAEIGEPEAVRDRLVDAATVLGDALGALHAPGATTLLDRAGPLVARSLATIHPARAELERALREVPPSQTPPSAAPSSRAGSSDAKERRTAPRVRIEGAIGAQSGATFVAGEASDLSTGGLFVATGDPLPIGTELTLGLLLPDGHRVVVDAVVSWVRGPHDGRAEGMGVRFLRVSREDAAAISRHAE
ncbi:TIGR02266 family protein [Sandaracinus amylolyticus]|uniref:Signal recognition particle receptor protein FtsY n=1 Tax=Sandaracinus amylolyticus TaxID=927083 RepID=A0A0F6W2G1_9BACT|nr:TIGR02266 family protein [Sandaracinus amylolyticus]AKF05793.1 Signal recognition particle receptor protein FtsY [Sandaracinus amylolyticus]